MIIHPAIKLRHIRCFLDIATEGTLSQVARAQGLSQPALSRSLAELEDLLGTPLFHRRGRRLVLTDAGAAFRSHARRAVHALQAGVDALFPNGGTGTLRIGILPTVATRFFPAVALRLMVQRPNLLLAVETGPHFHLMKLLRDGQIDLMFGRMPMSSDMADMRFDHLYEDAIVLVARAGHPLIGQQVADILRRVPVILPPSTAIIRRVVDDYLTSLDLSGLRPAMETVAMALGRGVLIGSDAVWFISRGVVADDLSRGDLVMIDTQVAFLSGADVGPGGIGRPLALCRADRPGQKRHLGLDRHQIAA